VRRSLVVVVGRITWSRIIDAPRSRPMPFSMPRNAATPTSAPRGARRGLRRAGRAGSQDASAATLSPASVTRVPRARPARPAATDPDGGRIEADPGEIDPIRTAIIGRSAQESAA
jgi:hypothetical protein